MSENREFFDFVLCKHENSDKSYLFRAPAFTHLTKGDLVVVETKKRRGNGNGCLKHDSF